jgi:predicted SAM-dependent methyltransferase
VLPFQAEQFEEVLFKHALEHFRKDVGERLLLEIKRVLKKGGYVDIYVPDLELACTDFLTGANNPAFAHPLSRIYGLNTSEQQVHKWGYSEKSLMELLTNLKFSNIQKIPVNDMDELALRAYK